MLYRNIVAVLVLLFYSPSFIGSVSLTWRHGWRASYETWFVLATFSASRIAYGALQLSTIAQPDRIGLQIAAGTFAVDGLCPLLFFSVGLLHRLLDIVQKIHPSISLRLRHIRILEYLITAAFISASVGFSGLTIEEVENGIRHHPATSRAAAIMYVIGLAGIVLSAGIVFVHRIHVLDREKRILFILVASLPVLFVRTLYIALDVLGGIARFSAISGDVTTLLCMALLEEMLLVATYMWLGSTMQVVYKKAGGQDDNRRSLDGTQPLN